LTKGVKKPSLVNTIQGDGFYILKRHKEKRYSIGHFLNGGFLSAQAGTGTVTAHALAVTVWGSTACIVAALA